MKKKPDSKNGALNLNRTALKLIQHLESGSKQKFLELAKIISKGALHSSLNSLIVKGVVNKSNFEYTLSEKGVIFREALEILTKRWNFSLKEIASVLNNSLNLEILTHLNSLGRASFSQILSHLLNLQSYKTITNSNLAYTLNKHVSIKLIEKIPPDYKFYRLTSKGNVISIVFGDLKRLLIGSSLEDSQIKARRKELRKKRYFAMIKSDIYTNDGSNLEGSLFSEVLFYLLPYLTEQLGFKVDIYAQPLFPGLRGFILVKPLYNNKVIVEVDISELGLMVDVRTGFHGESAPFNPELNDELIERFRLLYRYFYRLLTEIPKNVRKKLYERTEPIHSNGFLLGKAETYYELITSKLKSKYPELSVRIMTMDCDSCFDSGHDPLLEDISHESRRYFLEK